MKTNKSRIITVVISIMLIAAMAFTMNGCGKETAASSEPTVNTQVTRLGKGDTQFTFIVDDGKSTQEFLISTDKDTVGDALLELGLIAGDKSEYGLYVKTVNGVTLDYDTDKAYWAFYVDDEYASAGVDATNIEKGVTYAFKNTKG